MRTILIGAGCVLALIVTVVLVGGVYIYTQLPPREAYQCASQNEQLSQTNKYKVEMTQKVCGGIAFSSTVSLAISSELGDRQTTFFAYGRGSSDPKLKWVSDSVLLVEVSDVGEVYTQVDRVGDVQIRYQIGKIGTK